MTSACNIPEGIAAGAASRVAPTADSVRDALAALRALSPEQRRCMGRKGCELVTRRFTWDILAADMQAVYAWILGGGSPPACVWLD